MEDFEINSNESQKLDEDKVKPEVNNNRSSKYTYEEFIGGGVDSEKSPEGAKILYDTERDNGVMEVIRKKSDCHDFYRCEQTPPDADTSEELVEEIILLPNNFISDDELSSNSDDCIYAYRGGHINNVEPNLVMEHVNLEDDGQDEETDFLEMDFDPEPNSEIENFIEDEHHFNHLEANFFSLRGEEGLRELPSVSQLRQNGSGSPLDTFQSTTDKELETDKESKVKISKDVYTGAKPKLVTSSSTHKLSSSSSSYSNKEPTTPDSNYCKPSTSYGTSSHTDDSCLECAEAEFIFQTKPGFSVERKCRRHRNKEVPSLSYSSPPPPESCPVVTTTPIASKSPKQSQPVDNSKEFMVTIYSINCDYETIVEATNLIGVTMCTEILQHYFDNLADEETATMSVPEYLLYVSKRNCNYKRLIDVIRAACLSPVDIHFYPHDPYSSATPEIVQISTSEITQRWNRNTDLRQILKFKNKNFKSLNVLGKVVNAIRQYESGDRLKISNSHINIPQYYRSGYICITKLANPDVVIACS